ncbi:MAG: DNA alkylation repair protein, partial [Wujia sp.]
MIEQIVDELFKLQDIGYGDFHSGLMPEIDRDRIIGVRTPELRKLAKRICNEPYIDEFLNTLPHYYYEENNLHGALLVLRYQDVDKLLDKLELFLPFVDNWATCDMLSPKVFKKDLPKVYDRIEPWIYSEHTYQQRFAIVTLLGYFLDEAFEQKHLELVAGIETGEYY